MYTYQVDWFTPQLPLWEQYILPFKGKEHLVFLEIGSFEGRSAVWLLTEVLTHSTSRLVCVDPFHGSVENQNKNGLDLSKIETNFDHNIRETGNASRVTKMKMAFIEAAPKLSFHSFDFIYIDGSHVAPDVLTDAVLSFHLLKVGGMMVFDDYEWNEPGMVGLDTPQPAVDAFLSVFANRIKVIYKGIQVFVIKTQ